MLFFLSEVVFLLVDYRGRRPHNIGLLQRDHVRRNVMVRSLDLVLLLGQRPMLLGLFLIFLEEECA